MISAQFLEGLISVVAGGGQCWGTGGGAGRAGPLIARGAAPARHKASCLLGKMPSLRSPSSVLGKGDGGNGVFLWVCVSVTVYLLIGFSSANCVRLTIASGPGVVQTRGVSRLLERGRDCDCKAYSVMTASERRACCV
ncbi:hypothetical protein BaRGS_00016349 [Batillaria attramentaria]|uniref:Uncharacterized protein n=1 Tax=Batillaria attramentaria TaxID=370345 RepID=A0ABD0KZ01_9CAEN